MARGNSRRVPALLGLPRTTDAEPIQVSPTLWLATAPVDGTTLAVTDGDPPSHTDATYLVVRGPCYLALAAALQHAHPLDGIVLLAEKGRRLTARDVTEATGIPVVAQVTVSEAVARIIDAGLLLGRLHHLADLRQLRHLAVPTGRPTRHSTANPSRRSDAHFRQSTTTRSTNATVAFTQDVYMHAIPRMEEEAAQQIANLVLGPGRNDTDP